jgi:hypothetical protein
MLMSIILKEDKRRTEKIICECGSCVRKSDIAEHKKRKKHIQWEQST